MADSLDDAVRNLLGPEDAVHVVTAEAAVHILRIILDTDHARGNRLRIFGVDFPEKEQEKRDLLSSDMDDFSLEERKWNPFFMEFYEKKDDRR